MTFDSSGLVAVFIILAVVVLGLFTVSDVMQRVEGAIDVAAQDCGVQPRYCSWNETTQTFRFNMTRFNETWGITQNSQWWNI